jgi:hypothetical protein
MAEPWFDPNQFGGWYGAIAGSGCGLLGALIGTLAGTLAPRGVGRKWVLGLIYSAIGIGVTQLLFGVYAWLAGQPRGIWYGPLYLGTFMVIMFGAGIAIVQTPYREAANRRLTAKGSDLGGR